MKEKGGNSHSIFLKTHRNYCYRYGDYWRINKKGVYYGSYASLEDAKKVSDKLKEHDWDKSKLQQIIKETGVIPRTRFNYGQSGIFNVHVKKDKGYKQGYIYTYPYVEKGKQRLLSSTDINKLREKVKQKNLKWYGDEND